VTGSLRKCAKSLRKGSLFCRRTNATMKAVCGPVPFYGLHIGGSLMPIRMGWRCSGLQGIRRQDFSQLHSGV
jgi:hypothetical protein